MLLRVPDAALDDLNRDLSTALANELVQRVYEAAILKTLGGSSRLIATMLLLEYGLVGTIAGTVRAIGAIALSWAVARFALELNWAATSTAGYTACQHVRRGRLCRTVITVRLKAELYVQIGNAPERAW